MSEKERLKLIDALRGVALLGILLMNIPGFAMPDYSSESFKSDPGERQLLGVGRDLGRL